MIDPALQCRAGQELLRQSREVAARPLQGGNASLGAMADSSGSELGDPVDPLNMEGLEEGEVPPSPTQKDESMDVGAEEGKNSEGDGTSQSEQESWQQKPGLDEKGHDPSQSWLGRSEDEEKSDAAEARRLSRQEKEEQRKEHERDFPPTTLFISQRPDPADDPSGWYQGEDCVNPSTITAVSKRMALPTPDGALSGNGKEPLPSLTGPSKYRGRPLERKIKLARLKPDSEGRYPSLSRQELKQRDSAQREVLQRDKDWSQEMDKYACHPTEHSSPVHFCDPRQAEVIRALPYHVVAPMSYEYPYWAGQAQETISSRLLMASHYGFQVVRTG